MANAPQRLSSPQDNTSLVEQHAPSWTGPAGTYVPVRVSRNPPPNGKLELIEGQLTTTSERRLGSKDLTTIHIRKPTNPILDRRPAVITTGVVDTEEKMAQLEVVLKTCQQEGRPMRVSMHQLNNRLDESAMIEGERTQAALLGKRLQGEGASPSLSITENCVSALTQRVFGGSTPISFNAEAYGTYMQWALEDSDLTSIKRELEEKETKSPAEQQLLTLLQKIPQDCGAISKALAQNKALRQAFFSQPSIQENKKFLILHELMDNPRVKDSARVLLELAFDREVGAISHMNCKSGLDRTGHIRALDDALSTLIAEEPSLLPKEPGAYVEFLSHVTSHMAEWNEATRHAREPADIQSCIAQAEEPEPKNRFTLCYRLQTCYFDAFQRVAIPITAVTSGVPGAKFGQKAKKEKLFANPHPMPFLPMFAIKPDGVTPERIITESGRRTLTPRGAELLQGLSKERGG